MRWPIHIQLLVPMLAVVILAIVAASAASAYLGGVKAQRQQEENLQRVVDTLTDAAFPLTEKVLRRMTGLSGAEFVFLDPDGHREANTLPLAGGELDVIVRLSRDLSAARAAAGPPPHGPREPAAPAARFLPGRLVRLGDHVYLAESVPLAGPPRPSMGTLVVLYRHDRWSAAAWQGVYPALIVGAAAAIVAVLVTAGLARRFVRPIQRLGDQAAAIVGGNFQSVAVSARNDEIRDLALAINHMAGRLSQYENDVRRNERLRTLGQLGAGIAHQMRNAATGARMAVELHQRECPACGPGGPGGAAGSDDQSLSIALRQFRLMEAHLQRFMTLGRGEADRRQPVALVPLVQEALELVRPACRHAGIEVLVHTADDQLQISGDAESLRQLVVNLVLNAIEAAAPSGTQQPGTAPPPKIRIDMDCGPGQALLQIKDSGPGPAPHVQQRLFEPFVTGKADGTGLGLYVARQIVEAHGGTLTWRRADGMTCFTAAFPLLET